MKRIDTLVINITDICNMQCPFCLRGDGSNRKLNLSLIPKIFDGIDVIERITITGGEPSCYKKAIKAIVEYLVKNQDKIQVNGLYIVTNGKEYCKELVDAVKTMLFIYLKRNYDTVTISEKKAHWYNSDLEETLYNFGVAVSIDMYHEEIPVENWFKYRLSGVYSNSKEVDYTKYAVIARGRGVGIAKSIFREYTEPSIEKDDSDDICADEIYVSVEGQIFGDCDMSYEMEEYTEPVGDLEEETLAEIMQRMVEEDDE